MKKCLKPFIKEMIISFFLITVVICTTIYEVFSLKLKISVISVGFLISLIFFLIHSFKSIKIGLLALLDLFSKSTYVVKGNLQAQIPYEGSWLTDKFDDELRINPETRFCFIIKIRSHKVSYISTEYIDVSVGEECELLIAKHSGIIIKAQKMQKM